MSATDAPPSGNGWFSRLSRIVSNALNAVRSAVSSLLNFVRRLVVGVCNLVIAHPELAIAFAILVLGVLLAQPLAKIIVRVILGFTPSGVQAGSIAAQIQSIFYGGFVPAGSVFSFLQSFGAL